MSWGIAFLPFLHQGQKLHSNSKGRLLRWNVQRFYLRFQTIKLPKRSGDFVKIRLSIVVNWWFGSRWFGFSETRYSTQRKKNPNPGNHFRGIQSESAASPGVSNSPMKTPPAGDDRPSRDLQLDTPILEGHVIKTHHWLKGSRFDSTIPKKGDENSRIAFSVKNGRFPFTTSELSSPLQENDFHWKIGDQIATTKLSCPVDSIRALFIP